MFRLSLSMMLLFAGVIFSGCQKKEKVLDVETPSGSIEINKSEETGEVEIDVDSKE